MYKTCAGILHWGNGQFKQRPREEQAEVADSAGKYAIFDKNQLACFVGSESSFEIKIFYFGF
jgi:hypothetical protein